VRVGVGLARERERIDLLLQVTELDLLRVDLRLELLHPANGRAHAGTHTDMREKRGGGL